MTSNLAFPTGNDPLTDTLKVRSSDEGLGLALSGGGFRATLFHLGVVRAMAETGLLAHVTQITSVSGGSVLGAHLVLNWDAYSNASRAFASAAAGTGEHRERASREAAKLFDQASGPLLGFIETDVRNRIIRRLPLNTFIGFFGNLIAFPAKLAGDAAYRHAVSFVNRRGLLEQLVGHFESLFGDKKLSELNLPGAPRLHILTTEVASMKLGSFTADGFHQPGSDSGVGRDILTIARSVAASAAFPALFPPARLDGGKFRLPGSQDSCVTDAGVYDNLGISEFLRDRSGRETFQVLVSDATATSEWSTGSIPNLLTNLLRSVDIMQQRAAQLQRDKVNLPQRDARAGNAADRVEAQGRFVLFDIARENIREQPKIGETAQRHVSYLRTDLDAFSSDEMRLLVHHGYSVAWHTLQEAGLASLAAPTFFETWRNDWPRTTRVHSDETAVEILQEGRRSRLRFFVFSDPIGILNLVILIMILSFIPAQLVVERYKRAAAEEEVRQQAELEQRRFSESRIESFRDFSFPPVQPRPLSTVSAEERLESFDGVAISAFEKMFDLRGWRPVPTALRQVEPIEPALQQTIYTVRRASRATSLLFRLKTGGLAIMPEVPTLDAQLFQETVIEDRFPKQVVVQIDLTRIPPNMDYPVIVRGTFWNGFQRPIEDASFRTVTESDHGRMIVMFPTNRVPRYFSFWRMPAGSTAIEVMPVAPYHHFHQNGIYFEVDRPQLHYTYGIQFTWDNEGTGPMGTFTPKLSSVLLRAL